LNQRVPGKSFPVALEAAITRALAKKREERFETSVEFGYALKRCLSNPLANTAAGRALPSDPAPRSAGGARSSATDGGPSSDADPPSVPVTRGPMIALGVLGAVLLLVLGVWLGSMLGKG
jgi:hypothetical protein